MYYFKTLSPNDWMIFIGAVIIAFFTLRKSFFSELKNKQDGKNIESIKVDASTILKIQQKIDATQDTMTKTLQSVELVQYKLAKVQNDMDNFIRLNAEQENQYKINRKNDAKIEAIQIYKIIDNQLVRLITHSYYTYKEYMFKTRDDINKCYESIIKLRTNIYVSETPEISRQIAELDAIVKEACNWINSNDDIPENLNKLNDNLSKFWEKGNELLKEG
ncbi:MAG: hypothetical protein J0M30_12590 [Chitinophagales bacterium]|nr:hypothetical protein [Chitinophagales bacterium]